MKPTKPRQARKEVLHVDSKGRVSLPAWMWKGLLKQSGSRAKSYSGMHAAVKKEFTALLYRALSDDSAHCHSCQIKRGGKVPAGVRAVTVTAGVCSLCKSQATLVPNSDYIWKDSTYIWD